eukprot:CAMPEP_0196999974 /NCGR_PEP_ID=MMETSP1380-20130617/5043_1 /TAXON_ID=5936 /ORGANISM="Euplotes crassus, Strain CT5" /LENGTH=130 /DNA_ID=CAMNT_0042417107 /DNA_START=269 /DNA_END=661 /DNA_ORIENTATION=-
MLKEATIVEEIGSGLGYEYARMKGSFIFSDRDFCTVRHRKEEENGRIIITAYSAEHPDCPKVKKAVRGTMHIFGYVITPNSEDNQKCTAQLIVHANLGGNIPGMIANKVVEANGKFLHKLNKKLKADSEE